MRSRRPSRSAANVSSALIAPPEVPLTATISWPSKAPRSTSRDTTPAVKAVWLPPPWKASAILTGSR